MRAESSSTITRFLLLALAATAVLSPGLAVGNSPPPVVVEGYADASDGVRLRFQRLGDSADPLIVLHGGPGLTLEYLADDLSPLAREGSVVFYDQRGTGRSTLVADPAALDAERFADDLDAVRQHFGLERVTLVGHSWGAGIAAIYAMRYPDRVSRMVLIGPMPLRRSELDRSFAEIRASRSPEETERLLAARDAVRADPGNADACREFYALWFRPFFADPADMTKTRGDFCTGSPEALRNAGLAVGRHTMASLGDFDWRDSLKRVSSPVLVLHGSEDPIPVSAAKEWAAAFPNARLLLLEGVGHFPYIEAPEAFFPAVDAFLAGEWPKGVQSPGP
jgi:proline iminopeptidase